jgi:hypothetical protein
MALRLIASGPNGRVWRTELPVTVLADLVRYGWAKSLDVGAVAITPEGKRVLEAAQ